ncbi:hypothetical protein VTK26DRAFT_600 [Humicola hyalothermophila]
MLASGRRRSLLLAVLHGGGGEDERRLRQVARQQPEAAARADQVAELARQPGGGEEEPQGDGDVGRDEGVAVEVREDDGEDQEDGVAGAVEIHSDVRWRSSSSTDTRGNRCDSAKREYLPDSHERCLNVCVPALKTATFCQLAALITECAGKFRALFHYSNINSGANLIRTDCQFR